MSEKKLTVDQESRINAIIDQWRADIDKIPEARGLSSNSFSQKWAEEAEMPYLRLRNKYMPMIEKIKEE
ncbi:MAG: hypothetical protein IJL97_03785 [Lachnospiraceae bacterium]|nr:hypothetical protein [Clostridia bacterium]MBR0085652.1 hypothetical protein [Lachnospiraceae bacterium]